MHTIALIVSMSKNQVIGHNNKIPWHLPADLQYFKRITMGKPMIMGRQTFESIGKPLPGRESIVVTGNLDWTAPHGVHVTHSVDQAIDLAKTLTPETIMVIGGSQLYEAALPLATRLYITYVDVTLDGDTRFPNWDKQQWKEISQDRHHKDEKNPYNYSFCVYERDV